MGCRSEIYSSLLASVSEETEVPEDSIASTSRCAEAVDSLGGVKEDKPYYNSYALATVANMVYSDHAKSIAEDMGYKTVSDVPNEKMALSCYRKAVELLKDPDSGFHARKYFKDKMYDD